MVSIQLFRVKLWFEFNISSVHAIRTTKFTTSSLKEEEVVSSETVVSFCWATDPQFQNSTLNLVIVRVIQNT